MYSSRGILFPTILNRKTFSNIFFRITKLLWYDHIWDFCAFTEQWEWTCFFLNLASSHIIVVSRDVSRGSMNGDASESWWMKEHMCELEQKGVIACQEFEIGACCDRPPGASTHRQPTLHRLCDNDNRTNLWCNCQNKHPKTLYPLNRSNRSVVLFRKVK